MAQATPTRIFQRPDGLFEITWNDGFTWGPISLDDLKKQLEEKAPDNPEQTKWAMLAYGLRLSPQLTSTVAILNKTLTFDLSLPNVWRIQ